MFGRINFDKIENFDNIAVICSRPCIWYHKAVNQKTNNKIILLEKVANVI